MTGFFEEVKRRKVYRVAAAYIIVAGCIIQILSATFPAWELPPWSLRLVILLLLVGFPIALILAWAFDITPQGIRATPETTAPRTGRRRNMIMLIATGVALPSAPGFFGVFEKLATVGLAIYGIQATAATSWAIGYHILSFIPVTVIGIYYFSRLGLSFSELRTQPESSG